MEFYLFSILKNKKDGNRRMILNIERLNKYTEPKHFKTES